MRWPVVVGVLIVTSTGRLARAQVTFTPAAALDGPEARLPLGITFTPVPRRDTSSQPSRANVASPRAGVSTSEPERSTRTAHRANPESARGEPPRSAALRDESSVLESASALSSRGPSPSPSIDPPSSSERTACSLTHGIEEISIEDPPTTQAPALHGQELSLSAYGNEVVALVTMARPGVGREGLVFSQSKLISIAPDRPTQVASAPGFEPGSVVALGPESTVYVLSSPRVDRRAQRAAEDLRITVLDTRGAVRSPPRSIDGTRGYTVDSALIAWRGGVAVVLGEPSIVGVERAFGPVRERVFSFDHEGVLRAAPWVLTEAQAPDAVGRFRVGLGRVAGGDALAAVFSDGRALWARRFVGHAPVESAARIYEGRVWGPEISRDGAAIIFREDGTNGRPVRLHVARWDGANTFEVGQGWEPLASVFGARVLVAGALVPLDDGRRTTALFTESVSGARPRVLAAPTGSHARLDEAIDVAFTATDDGAVLAWLEAVDRSRLDGPRRLAFARVRCR